VPLGVTSIGTLIRRDSTTPTVGVGGAAFSAAGRQAGSANASDASTAAGRTRVTPRETRSKILISRLPTITEARTGRAPGTPSAPGRRPAPDSADPSPDRPNRFSPGAFDLFRGPSSESKP